MEFGFSQLSEALRRALKDLGFEKPTPIQKEAIP
jgi:ATP-dependent RNA helicase DeaD